LGQCHPTKSHYFAPLNNFTPATVFFTLYTYYINNHCTLFEDLLSQRISAPHH